ncbi:MAG TPA: hypothetical protein VIU63_11360 [Nitrospira sp.]
MPNLKVIDRDDAVDEESQPRSFTPWLLVQWIVGITLAFGLGTWLVWWAVYTQRQFVLEEIRSACARVMPETTDRCVDTVIIQRGGARR